MAHLTHVDYAAHGRIGPETKAEPAPLSPRAALFTWLLSSLGGWALVVIGLTALS